MAADGMIRVRCKFCHKLGAKNNYVIKKMKDILCKHEVSFQALYPIPGRRKPDVATYRPHHDPNKPPAFQQADLFLAEKKILYSKNPQYQKPQAVMGDTCCDTYLERLKNSGAVGAMSYTGYASIVNTHIRPFIAGHLMSAITREMLIKLLESVANHSKETKIKVKRHLKGIFRDAKLDRIILENVTESLKRQAKSKNVIYEILSPQGIKDLIHQTDRPRSLHGPKKPHISNLFLELYYLLPIYTGLRASEIAGLGREHCIIEPPYRINVRRKIRYFNNKKEEIYAKEHKQEGVTIHGRWWMGEGPAGLKSPASYRTIPIPKFLAEKLQIFFIEQPENPHNLVFATKEGEPIDHRIMTRIHFRPARKAAGLPTIKYHELRHTFCSIHIKEGLNRGIVDLKLIQQWMGHDEKDIRVTYGIYTQIIKDNRDHSAIAEAFAAYIDGSVSASCQFPTTEKVKNEQTIQISVDIQ